MDKSHFNTIEDVRKSGSHLSLEERGMIQALHRQGLSLRSITAEVFGTKIYFTHPYSSWECPQNERHNGLLRDFILHPEGDVYRAFYG